MKWRKKKFSIISIGCITYKRERISSNISLVKYFSPNKMTKNGDFISDLNSLQYLVHSPKSATTCSVDRLDRQDIRWQRSEDRGQKSEDG
jgi:hypothetical protein